MEHSRKYLSYRDPFYLEWALDAFFNWKQKKPLNYVIHIHGTYDMVFPIIYLKEFIPCGFSKIKYEFFVFLIKVALKSF